MADRELVCQGAEARVYTTSWQGKKAILKERFSKKYRIPALDAKLTKKRLLQEARSLERSKAAGVPAPEVYASDPKAGTIYMEYLEKAITVKQYLREQHSVDVEANRPMLTDMGRCIAHLHNRDLIHGDLTTSNMMLRTNSAAPGSPTEGSAAGDAGELVFIDFGLSQVSTSVEEKAVDLYVLERAFASTHPGADALFAEVLRAYESAMKPVKGMSVLAKLSEVQARGRKRSMLG